MKSAREILFIGRKVLDDAIRKEARNQGHYLTGNLERSLTATITETANETILEGEIAFYAQILNDGVAPAKASMKQFPFVVKFFQLRGLPEKEAKRAAAATIKKWMKSGMPTFASRRFSKNGQRKHLLSESFNKSAKKLNDALSREFDRELNSEFLKTKSETV